jgi:multiple sugar transport system ATP-binding protein
MAEIRFEKLKKRFRDIRVIKELDLTINDGEFFTFVGPSGCGKSTILNMIAGLEPVIDGRIYFDNTIVNELSPKDRDIAMVFQIYALYPHMTVYDNISFPLKMKKIDDKTIHNEVDRVAGILGIKELLHRKPKELSGGQRQRVALGRAIIRKPKVFLMDEPLSNLDARLRVEMRSELKRLHSELKITTVYVTHDQAEAISLSDRVAVLHQGEIQQCGTPSEVYLNPANIFVAGFIGSPPMNFIPGTVLDTRPLQINLNGVIITPLIKTLTEKKSVIAGIRPEDILVTDVQSDDSIEITVALVEPAGSFNWVDIMWNDISIKGYAQVGANLKAGKKAFMKFPVNKIILFDADTGERL